jgi:hypothetical protein
MARYRLLQLGVNHFMAEGMVFKVSAALRARRVETLQEILYTVTKTLMTLVRNVTKYHNV